MIRNVIEIELNYDERVLLKLMIAKTGPQDLYAFLTLPMFNLALIQASVTSKMLIAASSYLDLPRSPQISDLEFPCQVFSIPQIHHPNAISNRCTNTKTYRILFRKSS